MSDTQSWISDGTEEAEPETTETPAAEVETEAAETVEVAETAEIAEAVETEDAETAEEVVQNFIEGKLGEEAFQLPEGVLLPQKRGDTTEYVPITDILKEGMMGRDYTAKTTELADIRRATDSREADIVKREARLEADRKYMEGQQAELNAALTDPQSALAFQEHLVQYEKNPIYRKHVDSALTQHQTEAELSALQQNEDQRIVNEASNLAMGWIDDLKTEYEGVDPDRVRAIYSRELKLGEASLDRSAVQRIYEAENDHVNQTLSPLQGKLDEITAQLASLQAGAAATEHNDQTAHAVKRAKTTPVATGKGAPTSVPVEAEKFGPNQLQGKVSEWSKAGRA